MCIVCVFVWFQGWIIGSHTCKECASPLNHTLLVRCASETANSYVTGTHENWHDIKGKITLFQLFSQ